MKKSNSNTKAFTLTNDGPIVFLFHGLTGSPYDLRPLASYLNQQGFEVHVPLLAGHGGMVKELFGVNTKRWLKDMTCELNAVTKERPLILGGLSMGALIALSLATKFDTKALILLSPSLRLHLSAELLIASASLGLLDENHIIPKKDGKSDIADPHARDLCPSYEGIPLKSLRELSKLRNCSLKRLPDITCPLFLAFGALDGAIDINASRDAIFRKTRAFPIKSKTYINSKHVLTLDYDKSALFKDIANFLTSELRF